MNASELAHFENLMIPVTETGCWLWLGATTGKSGYAYWKSGAGSRLAHRKSYEHFVGPIMDGLELDHKCQVRTCVNPEHLQPVTPTQNRLLVAQRRTHCRNGHPLTGLSADIRPDATSYEGISRVCRVCMRANMARFTAKHGGANAAWKQWAERAGHRQ